MKSNKFKIFISHTFFILKYWLKIKDYKNLVS